MSDVDVTAYPGLRSGRILTDLKTTVSTANTYHFRNNGQMLLHVANASGSTVTATFAQPNPVSGYATTATLATAKAGFFGPFPPSIYNNGDGEVQVTFDQIVDVTVIQV